MQSRSAAQVTLIIPIEIVPGIRERMHLDTSPWRGYNFQERISRNAVHLVEHDARFEAFKRIFIDDICVCFSHKRGIKIVP